MSGGEGGMRIMLLYEGSDDYDGCRFDLKLIIAKCSLPAALAWLNRAARL